MTAEPNDTDAGRGTLRPHVSHAEPPPALAARVRETLEARGLVRSTTGGARLWVVRAALIAAGVLLGVVGRGAYQEARESRSVAAVAVPNGPRIEQYVLLLYGDTPGDTGAVHVAREREYGRWASALGDGARWVGGHELHEVVARLGGGGSAPADTASERVAGFFVIEARSREQAAEVARTCPHLRYGGRVVVMTVAS